MIWSRLPPIQPSVSRPGRMSGCASPATSFAGWPALAASCCSLQHTDEMTTASILDLAISVLRSNDTGIFTKPGPHQYPHQWNWDSALIALGFSHFDLPRAQSEIRALLSGQWKDGMLPHVVYH